MSVFCIDIFCIFVVIVNWLFCPIVTFKELIPASRLQQSPPHWVPVDDPISCGDFYILKPPYLMTFLEKNLEDILYETPNEKLRERGLRINGKKRRQVRIGNYGIADLVTYQKYDKEPTYWQVPEGKTIHESSPYWSSWDLHSKLEISIFELKQNLINEETFLQAIRYCKGIKSYIECYRGKDVNLDLNIILIGQEVSPNSFVYIPDIFPNVSLYTYSYNFDGIKFREIENWLPSGGEGF